MIVSRVGQQKTSLLLQKRTGRKSREKQGPIYRPAKELRSTGQHIRMIREYTAVDGKGKRPGKDNAKQTNEHDVTANTVITMLAIPRRRIYNVRTWADKQSIRN